MNKPYSESCDQNREPILSVIRPLLANCNNLLEIGSGTGQHAVYFAEQMPTLIWHTSDCMQYLQGIERWIDEAGLENVRRPIVLDVSHSTWPAITVDAVFTANSIHIMHWQDVVALFAGAAKLLKGEGILITYGPFNYNNTFTSESNERFDCWLKSRDPHSGIKDFEALNQLADTVGMRLIDDVQMPANNRILIWQRPD